MRGGRNVGMLILERPCQSATAVPQHKGILPCFSWKPMTVCSQYVLSASRCRQAARPLQTGGGGRSTEQWSPGWACWAASLSATIPRLFPWHLGFPLLPLIFFFYRPLVIHIRKDFVYPDRGNNWKQTGYKTSHSVKPMLTFCDHTETNKKQKENNCFSV